MNEEKRRWVCIVRDIHVGFIIRTPSPRLPMSGSEEEDCYPNLIPFTPQRYTPTTLHRYSPLLRYRSGYQ